MVSKFGPQKPWYHSKAKMLAEVEPYKITKIISAQECYVDKSTLQAYNLGVFIGTYKTEQEVVWTMIILPEKFRKMQVHANAMAIYGKVGLESYFSLPSLGMDILRAHQVLTTLQANGMATLQDSHGMEVTVTITKETIRDAPMMPIGSQSLLIRNLTQEINDTIMLMGESNYTFKDLIQ